MRKCELEGYKEVNRATAISTAIISANPMSVNGKLLNLNANHLLLIRIPMPKDVEASTNIGMASGSGGMIRGQPTESLDKHCNHQWISWSKAFDTECLMKGEDAVENEPEIQPATTTGATCSCCSVSGTSGSARSDG